MTLTDDQNRRPIWYLLIFRMRGLSGKYSNLEQVANMTFSNIQVRWFMWNSQKVGTGGLYDT